MGLMGKLGIVFSPINSIRPFNPIKPINLKSKLAQYIQKLG